MRARRWLLSGSPGPFLARVAPDDLPTPDLAEDGESAVRVWALWRQAGKLDAGWSRLERARVDRSGESLSLPEALAAAALEPDRDAAAALVKSAAREARQPVDDLAAAFAGAIELAAEHGSPRAVPEGELRAARELLAISEEPARDVLTWASLRAGRPRRARLALADVLRAVRNPSLDPLYPAVDPWPELEVWRRTLGLELAARTEVAAAPDCWPGSWALRGRRSRLVGTSGWPGALRARFALQGLGRLEVLSEGGFEALLPRDPAAAQLPAAVYPMFLAEATFLRRVFGSGRSEALDRDSRRLAALGEVLLQRAQAAALQVVSAFDETRRIGAATEAAEAVSRALHAATPRELGLSIAAPWAEGLSAWPSAVMTGAALIESWREGFDEDFWRNPRFAQPLRVLASRCAREPLAELAPEALAEGPGAYARWVDASLGA